MRLTFRTPLLLALLLAAAGTVAAQEFSVYTRIFDVQAAAGEAGGQPAARSLSLFHAGKVYDYFESAGDGEVIVYEPAHNRIRLLSTTRALATTIHVEQLAHKLEQARQVAEQHLQTLGGAAAGDSVAFRQLAFALDPQFHESFSEEPRRLTLSSPHLTYRVECAADDAARLTKPTIESYLAYADTVARLNYVLHPGAIGPESRLALNAALRRRGLMPVGVELETSIGRARHLRAEHRLHWQLDARDRGLIHEWETLLARGDLREVPLEEYQRMLLLSHAEKN